MNKAEIVSFFDSLADSWDNNMVKNQNIIDKILDLSEVTEGKRVLDVACGTGVLIPDYLARKIKKCVAIDISEKMIEIAKNKFSENAEVEFICADAESYDFKEMFDCIVIYNAFPHFADRNGLFENLSKHLKKDGRITVAHGMSRKDLIKHHSGNAKNVSTILPETDGLSEIMKPYFLVDKKISDSEMYLVSAINLK